MVRRAGADQFHIGIGLFFVESVELHMTILEKGIRNNKKSDEWAIDIFPSHVLPITVTFFDSKALVIPIE